MEQQFVRAGLPVPAFYPMIRGRLLAVNGQPLQLAKYTDERTRNLAEREFNLSWRDDLPEGNRMVAGRGFAATDIGQGVVTVEEGLAKTLNIKGDGKLTIAASDLAATVTVDASTNKGGVDFTAENTTTLTFEGGEGNDRVAFSAKGEITAADTIDLVLGGTVAKTEKFAVVIKKIALGAFV